MYIRKHPSFVKEVQQIRSEMAVLPKPRIEAIQSVTAFKMTDPRVTRLVDPGLASSFRRCFNAVLYFKRAEGDDFSGWDTAGWIKDSLGKAFAEEPILCGRLRRAQEGDRFEIVSNDSGARLVEARIGICLEEFVWSKGREEAEAELVYWKDIDQENPQYCPLFYIQVSVHPFVRFVYYKHWEMSDESQDI